jgi:CrcB protein
MTSLLLVLLGGGLGSAARYLVALMLANRFGAVLPWGTLAVNVLGSFLIGLLATQADEFGSISPQVRLFLVVGVLGGFTTFSSFSLESLRLIEQNDVTLALLNMAGNVAFGFTAATLGMALGRALEG